MGRLRGLCAVLRVNERQLDLELFRLYAFDVYRRLLAHPDALPRLCQAGQIRCQLHKDPIGLHGAHDSGDSLTGGEQGGVFLPCAQQFPVGQTNAAVFQRGDHAEDFHARGEAVARV